MELISSGIRPESNGKYMHWDHLRHRSPPVGMNHDEWWFATKMARVAARKSMGLADPAGKPFWLTLTEELLRKLHILDRQAGGAIKAGGPVDILASSEHRDRYLIRTLFEEAITSSQLEGASTTTSEAKQMLRSGRRPRDRSEQMILNNYRAMEFVREHRSAELSETLILDLHAIVTENTMDEPDAAGRWRRANEDIVVTDNRDGTVLYRPPHADLIPDRISTLCTWVNTEHEEMFIHPVVQAIVLHFMISYEHPFVDGNGRTARALFYWFMSRTGYWLIEFLSISRVIKESPAKYARAFLHVETDENDLTYFLHQQLDVIIEAISALHQYLSRKSEELRNTERILRGPVQKALNYRQVALLTHALRNPDHLYTIQSHKASNGVTYETARTDLLGLEDLELLSRFKRGNAYVFQAPRDLVGIIDRLNRKFSTKTGRP